MFLYGFTCGFSWFYIVSYGLILVFYVLYGFTSGFLQFHIGLSKVLYRFILGVLFDLLVYLVLHGIYIGFYEVLFGFIWSYSVLYRFLQGFLRF